MFRSDLESGAVLELADSPPIRTNSFNSLISRLASAVPAPTDMRPATADARLPQRWRAALTWPARSRRVVLLLVVTAVLNFFDLCSTLIESQRFHFEELNPVASAILHMPAAVLIGYKTGLVLAGSCILFALRRHTIAELASWLALAIYVGVTLRWGLYYTHLLESMNDPATNICAMTGQLLP